MKQCRQDEIAREIILAGCGRQLETEYQVFLDVEGVGCFRYDNAVPGFDPTDPNIIRLARRPPVCP